MAEHEEIIKQILARTEAVSGFPVHVMADPKITTHSLVTMARQDNTTHVIRYNPKYAAQADYYVALQCGFIQRHFALPAAERMDLAFDSSGRYTVEKLLNKAPLTKKLPPAAIQNLVEQLLSGLLVHLRSIPIVLRIDRDLAKDYPPLEPLQRAAVGRQIQENHSLLGNPATQNMPQQIVSATIAINAAYAVFWASQWNQPELTLPYAAAGSLATGERLLKAWNETAPEPGADRALIDAWAGILGLERWYYWVPYLRPDAGNARP